jgi:hypothetical protein
LEYDVKEKERNSENHFRFSWHKFVVAIDYPKGVNFPVVYEVDLENEKIKKCKIQPTNVTNSEGSISSVTRDRTLVRWAKKDISKGEGVLDLNGSKKHIVEQWFISSILRKPIYTKIS